MTLVPQHPSSLFSSSSVIDVDVQICNVLKKLVLGLQLSHHTIMSQLISVYGFCLSGWRSEKSMRICRLAICLALCYCRKLAIITAVCKHLRLNVLTVLTSEPRGLHVIIISLCVREERAFLSFLYWQIKQMLSLLITWTNSKDLIHQYPLKYFLQFFLKLYFRNFLRRLRPQKCSGTHKQQRGQASCWNANQRQKCTESDWL